MDDMIQKKERWMSRGEERIVFRWSWPRYLIRCVT